MSMNRWLLPDAISDLLPAQAKALEAMRRAILDCYRRSGYEMVVPPLIEYLDSLLIGSGEDLEHKTFKLVDQLSGRTLGVRADITPQVARIDAHMLHDRQVTRLCYCASVLRTRPNGLEASREPLQIGAEIYGHPGLEADIEAVDLLLQSLAIAGIGGTGRLRLDLCDLGLVRLLLADLPDVQEEEVFALMQARDLPDLRRLLKPSADRPAAAAVLELCQCFGPAEAVLERARGALGQWPQALLLLDRLERVVRSPRLIQHRSAVEIALDLADVRGFRYHTGLCFAVFAERHAQAVGRGGRYDGVGAVFGRARAATGFSLDLRELVELRELAQPSVAASIIVAPWSEDEDLMALIRELRASDQIVMQLLPGQTDVGPDQKVDRRIERENGCWKVRAAEDGEPAAGKVGTRDREAET
jgi:ATP phosphoribosyltransferase regulatory subunit